MDDVGKGNPPKITRWSRLRMANICIQNLSTVHDRFDAWYFYMQRAM